MFQQSSDSPHIAQECDDGLETRDCCCEEAPLDSLDTRERGFTPFNTEENKGERNDRLDPSQIREGDGGPSLSCETDPALLHNGNSADQQACSCENSETDCREQEKRSTTGLVSTGDIGDSSDGLQSGSERIVNRTCSCGQQKEEADKEDDLICETEGPEEENQEKGHNFLEEKELSEHSPIVEAGDMGITQSLDMPESSDVESCSQGAESDDEEVDECGDLIDPEEVREESKKPLDLNPDGDTPLDSLRQNLVENEMHACEDVCDKTDDTGTQLEGGICEKITCNVEGRRDLDSSGTCDQEETDEEFQESLEMPYFETDCDQQKEEFSDTPSRTSVAEDESVLHLHEVNQELLPVEKINLSLEDSMVEESEFDGQKLSSSSILQTELGPEPRSSTATSEDILEDLEVLLGSSFERMENVQGNQKNKPVWEAQVSAEEVLESAIPADMEKVNLPDDSSQDPRQDMTSSSEVMLGTSALDLSEEDAGVVFVNTESGDQRVLVDPSDILATSNEFGISEESLAVSAEDLLGVSVHSDHLDGALHVQNALDEDDIIGSSVCPEQAQANLDPVSQETEAAVQEAVQPMGEEDLLKGELNKKCKIFMMNCFLNKSCTWL